jgi:hypothetical protein
MVDQASKEWDENHDDEKYNNLLNEALDRSPDLWNVAADASMKYIIRSRHVPRNNPLDRDQKFIDIIKPMTNNAIYWADKALKDRTSHDKGDPEFVKACAFALLKNTRGAFEYLDKAIKLNDKYRSRIWDDPDIWEVISGMTHGETDIRFLKMYLEKLGYPMPREDEIKAHCNNRNNQNVSILYVVTKDIGEAKRLMIWSNYDENNTQLWGIWYSMLYSQWKEIYPNSQQEMRSVIGDDMIIPNNLLHTDHVELSDVMQFIFDHYIVTRIIENQ